jgi:hypothetical protein
VLFYFHKYLRTKRWYFEKTVATLFIAGPQSAVYMIRNTGYRPVDVVLLVEAWHRRGWVEKFYPPEITGSNPLMWWKLTEKGRRELTGRYSIKPKS